MSAVMTGAAGWTGAIAKAAALLDMRINDVVRLIALHIYRGVIMKTPVDEGDLRSAWNISLNRPEFITVPGGKGTGDLPSDLGRFPQVHITNGLPYAAVVEYGLYPGIGPKTTGGSNPTTGAGVFSRQAPAGMVEVTMREVEMQIRSIIG